MSEAVWLGEAESMGHGVCCRALRTMHPYITPIYNPYIIPIPALQVWANGRCYGSTGINPKP